MPDEPSRLEAIVAATPSTRDRYVDFLRAASILVVVLGHWMQAIVAWEDGRIALHGAVGVTSGLWLATWVLQVMPIFFFVGGFSNYAGLRAVDEGRTTLAAFLRARTRRLAVPLGVFAGVWVVVQGLLHGLDAGGTGLVRGVTVGAAFGPLWFLAVYLGVTLLSPVTRRWHAQRGWGVPIALGGVAVLVDVAAFGFGVAGARWINLATVWLLVHQLGYFYADGTLAGWPRSRLVTATVLGLATVIVLTNLGVYPRSMVGTDQAFFALKPIESISNMNPPTLVILAHSVWLIGGAMLLRDRASRWLEGPRVWAATVIVNLHIMTIFLWHMTAYAIVIALARPVGLGLELDSTPRWWLERPFWIIAPALVLLPLVALFSRFEQAKRGQAA